ncbi:MAG: PQQ-binding-like beta-propeller repeat protein [Planctomycetota bacterium]
MNRSVAVIAIAVAPAIACAQAWPFYGGNTSRVPVVEATADATTLDQPAWSLEQVPSGPVSVLTTTGPVSDGERVFFTADAGGTHRLIAIDIVTGIRLWDAEIPTPSQDSWASPAVDEENGSVLSATGDELRAHDTQTGSLLWTTTLARTIVNASPLITTDRGPADRAFIVHEDGSFLTFDGGVLYAINVDPFDAASNPHNPGEVVWSMPLDAAATGASVAYEAGVVILSDAGDPFFGGPGSVRAIDVSDAAPVELWRTDSPDGEGYFGGVSLLNGSVLAVTYGFFGGLDSASLVSLDASTGVEQWSLPTNRSSSIPIPLSDGRVLVSGGIDGFGSVPSLALFSSNGTSAAPLWLTATDTFNDLNTNDLIEDGEYLRIGGWTHLPAVLADGASRLGVVGTLAGAGVSFSAYNELRIVDLSLPPSDPGFVVCQTAGAGNTPIIAAGHILSLGPTGLFAFELPGGSIPGDANGDGVVDLDDLYAWYQDPNAELDANGDQVINADDARFIESIIRAGEIEDMTAGRR